MSRTSSSPTLEASTALGNSSAESTENGTNQESSGNSLNTDEAAAADNSHNLSRSSSMIREIYKNSWLKQIPCSDKWSGRIYKAQKPEKYWVVFCVHDEKDAFLEFYENRRSAYSHSPLSSVALSQCLHISPTIVVQDNDHEFVITLETQVIRLAASTREQMVEWMDTLRNKLRDLNILEPKDNLYSKEPMVGPKMQSHLSESSSSLESQTREDSNISSQSDNSLSRILLRDPTSPLPPVPPVTSQSRERVSQPVAYTRSPAVQPSTSSLLQTNQVDESVQTNDIVFSVASAIIPISRRESPTMQDQTPQTSNSPRRISCSVPSTPAAPESGLYEPLFRMTSTETSPNMLAMGIRNPSYENPPDTQRHSSPDTAPVLPPKLNSESRRLSMSALNVRSPRPVNIGSSSSQLAASLSNGANEPSHSSQSPVLSRSSRGEASANVHIVNNRVPTGRNSSQSDDEPILSSAYVPHSRSAQSADSVSQADESGRILSLREAQVLKLQSEIFHKSGVRLVLRKKDSVNAIAFVDGFGSVWVAGWKQKEHPLLHSAFHIGDRIFSVAGHKVHNTQEVLKLVKLQHIIVDFVVCRTPCAKVLALKKEYEGQDLGLVREGGTAEIKEVKPGGLALRYGLPQKAPTMDGSGTCNWFLTEINHRPLNLFFKDNEVQDRLNAVGLDISILVQPVELVKALKKQLKTIRGYKDYALA